MNYNVRRKGLPALIFALVLFALFVFGRAVATAQEIDEASLPAPQEAAALPTVRFSPTSYSPDEGITTVTLDVTLSGVSTETVTVDYATGDGSALDGSDYTAKSGTLTFLPGDTLENIDVDITEDLIDEIDESFTVTLSNAVSATLGTPNHVATVTITDNDDPPTVQFSPTSYDVDENGVSKQIFVTLSAESGKTVTVDYATSDGTATAGSDYTAASNTLTFNPGDTSKNFTVSITEDLIDEDPETIDLELSGESNATLGTPDHQGTITINDNDAEPTVGFSPATYDVGEADGTVTIIATLDAESGRTVTVDYSTSNGTAKAGQDYMAASDTLTFVPGDTSESFTVAINDDGKNEADESFNISLDPPVNASLGTSLATVTIQDNDTAPTVQFASANYPVGEGGPANVIVTLSSQSAQTVTVDYATSDGTATVGSDYSAASGTLTFVPDDVSESFSVNTSPDSLDEYDETIILTLSNESNAMLGTDTATVTIADGNDPPNVHFSNSLYSEYEETGPATIGVQLTAPSGKPITVTYATSNGSATAGVDYVATSNTLVFDPGQTSKNFNVQFIDDAANEFDETVNLALSNPVNANLGSPPNATLFILNNADPEPSVFFSSSTYEYLENVGSATITVTLSAPSGKIVTVDYDTSNGTATAPGDYIGTSNTLVFQPGQTTKTFPVTIINDSSNEPTETVNLTLSDPSNAILGFPSSATLNITNDDGPEVQFSMPSYSVPEDIGTATITATLSASFDQVVTVNYATSDGTASAPGDYGSTSGPLTFNPGVTVQTFTVPIVDDAIDEPTETVILSLSPVSNASCVSSCSSILNIIDTTPLPQVFFSSATYEVLESNGLASIGVTLSAASALQVTVPYTTSDGTANAPGDYTAVSDTLIIAPGLTSGTINVPIVDDATPEGLEWLNLFLGVPTNATLGSPSAATLNITDDDVDPLVRFSSSSYEVDEDAGSKTIDVTLSKQSDLQVTVDYTTSDGSAVAGSGSEFSHWSGDLTGPNNPEIIVMDSDKVVTAHFAAPVPGASPIIETAVLEPQAPNIVTYQETRTGGAINLSSVSTSASLTAANGHLYIAAVSSRNNVGVTNVNGLGLVWHELATQCSGREQTGVEVWWAQGVPSGADIVTASFAGAPNSSVIAVSRYSGVDTNDPTGNVVSANTRGLFDTTCSGTSDMDSASYNFNLATGTSNATVYSVAAIRATSHSPGASYTERFEFATGFGGSTTAVAGQDKNVGPPAAVAVDGSFSSAVDWAVIAVEIRPDSNGGTPFYTLNINTVGDGSVLLTPPGGVYPEDTIVTLTATGAGDYTPASGTLTFEPGVTSQSFEVPITDDGIQEFDETVNLELRNQTNADLGLASAVLNITDTSLPPAVQFDSSSLDFEVAEGVGTATFTVNLIPRSEKTVTVNYATCGGSATAGSDYSFTPTPLVFNPGEVSKTIPVVIIDDLSYEPDETVCLNLTTTVNATVGPNNPAFLTISQSDQPPTVRFATSSYNADETEGMASIEVIVTPASGFPLSVDYATSDGTAVGGVDYTPVTGTLTFNPGQTSLSFNVPITDDLISEPAVETVMLWLSNPVSATVGAPNPAQLGIFSAEESLPCVQFELSQDTVWEDVGSGEIQIDVELCEISENLVSVDYETSDGTAEAGSDYVSTSNTLIFDPGETLQSFDVPIINDDEVEEFLESFYLELSNPINAVLGVPYTMTVNIQDEDVPVFRTFLPTLFNKFVPSEPNFNCESAFKIFPNNGYWFLPDDSRDWYWFDLPAPVDEMTVELTNFTPGPGYLALDQGTQCLDKEEVGSIYSSATTKTLNVGPQPAGRYWILVTNDGNFSDTENYRLTIRTE